MKFIEEIFESFWKNDLKPNKFRHVKTFFLFLSVLSENYKWLNILKRFMEECKKDLDSNFVAEVVLTDTTNALYEVLIVRISA